LQFEKATWETTKESTVKRQITMTAAGLLLCLVPALAETQTTPNEALPSGPLTQAPAEAPATGAAPSILTAPAASGPIVDLNVHFLSRQMPDELLVSDLLGRHAVNADNVTIGDVNDVVTDSSGKAIGAVIGVGGFLGIGEKDVAVPFEDLKFSRDDDNDVRIEVDISKEALTNAPDFESLDEQSIVEGANKGQPQDKTRTY
jgi:sporulation protein YlmC with PRC-barrel domain